MAMDPYKKLIHKRSRLKKAGKDLTEVNEAIEKAKAEKAAAKAAAKAAEAAPATEEAANG